MNTYGYQGGQVENPFSDPRWYDEKVRNLTNLCTFVVRSWGESAVKYMIIPRKLLSEHSVNFLVDLFFSEYYEFYNGPGRAFGRRPYVRIDNERYVVLSHETGLDV